MIQITERFFPREVSFERLCEILVGFLNAGADRSSVPANVLPSKVSLSEGKISKNLKFLRSWGFIMEDEKGHNSYRLSSEAAEFASAYRIDATSQRTRDILRNFLSKDSVISQFAERLKKNPPERKDVIVELPKLIGDLTADRSGLNAFLDMIDYAYGITGYVVHSTSGKKQADRPLHPHPNLIEPSGHDHTGQISLNVNLNLDAKDPVAIKNAVDLLKKLRISVVEIEPSERNEKQ